MAMGHSYNDTDRGEPERFWEQIYSVLVCPR
jgi:hypothetical protein